jgi:8-oxo-dGTP pyrophosphatase MutT (NUDIX family)
MSPYLERLRGAVGNDLLIVPGAAGIVRDADGRVLVLRRADDGRWDLPAGATDPGETPAETVQREVREESGLVVRATRIAGVFGGRDFRHTYPDGSRVEGIVTVFECEWVGGELRHDDGEATDARFFAPHQMPPLIYPYPPTIFTAPGERASFQGAEVAAR